MEKTIFLLVDDDPTSNLITTYNIKMMLPEAQIKSFKEASRALGFIKSNWDHLQSQQAVYLFTDSNMPGMNGQELLEQLHQWKSDIAVHLRIFILSACDEDFRKDSSLASLVRGVLLKPLNQEALQGLLQDQ